MQARAKFSIGIDLGTTNCAMAFEALDGDDGRSSEVLPIPQWETVTGFSEATTLPSFLYLPAEREAARMLGAGAAQGEWIPGRFARKQAAEFPGRVVHSAKSWLCHHAVDRDAPFLPWRSDEIPVEKRISPIRASALLLEYLRAVWQSRFAGRGLGFDVQEISGLRLRPHAKPASLKGSAFWKNRRPHFTAGLNGRKHQKSSGDGCPAKQAAPGAWLPSSISVAARPTSAFLRLAPRPGRRFRTSSGLP
jgi:hypothetical protein